MAKYDIIKKSVIERFNDLDYLRSDHFGRNALWLENHDMSWAGDKFKNGADYILLQCDYEGADFYQIPFDHKPTVNEIKDAIKRMFYDGLSSDLYCDVVAKEYGYVHLPCENTIEKRFVPWMYKMSILIEYGYREE